MQTYPRRIYIVTILVMFLAGCEQDSPVNPPLNQYEGRVSGDWPLFGINVLAARNPIGPIIIQGETESTIRWFLDKQVSAESQSRADQIMSTMQPVFQPGADTVYAWPSQATIAGQESQACLLSLAIPYSMPCLIDQVSGEIRVADLDSTLTIRNAYTVTIERHRGSCEVSSLNGAINVQIAAPWNGYCRLTAENGDISLVIPSNCSGTIVAKSGHGTIDYSGLNFVHMQQQAGSLSGTLGSGNSEISVETKRGAIHLVGFEPYPYEL